MAEVSATPERFVPVPVAGIDKEVRRQVHAEQDVGGPPIQQARMANLVVYSDQPGQEAALSAEVAEIVATHPARVIFLGVDPDGESGDLEAAVRVRTRYVHGGRQEVASEQINLRASGLAADRLPFVVRGLLIGDLPTNLWWASRTPPTLAGPLLYDLSEQAQQIIYDSLGWIEPHRGVSATASWLARVERDAASGRWRVASDLNWRRLKPWRRLIAQALDPTTEPGAIESIHEVLIEHGPHAVTQAWLLASWLAARLGWDVRARKVQPGLEISWNVQTPSGALRLRIHRLAEGPSIIHRVRIACEICGDAGALNLLHEDRGRLSIVPEGRDAALRTMVLKPQPLAELVGRQLTDRERDPVFDEAMAIAQVLAQGVD